MLPCFLLVINRHSSFTIFLAQKKNYIRSKIRKIELCLPYFFIGILKICRLITYMINYFLKYNSIRKEYNRVIKCNFHPSLVNEIFLPDRVSSLRAILSATTSVKTSSCTPSGKIVSFFYCFSIILYPFSVSSSSVSV